MIQLSAFLQIYDEALMLQLIGHFMAPYARFIGQIISLIGGFIVLQRMLGLGDK